MQTGTPRKINISDRSKAAYLVAHGFIVSFVNRPGGQLDFSFSWTPEIEEAIRDYALNRQVQVQSFLTAQRMLSDAIRDHRRSWERG